MIARKHSILIVLFLCCFGFVSKASTSLPVIHIDSIPKVLSLDSNWLFHDGDEALWAAPSFSDNSWVAVNTDLKEKDGSRQFKGIGWFRLHLKVAPALFNKVFIFDITQAGASEVYLNGKRIYKFGVVSSTDHETPYDPSNNTYFIQLNGDTNQVIAIRYSAWTALERKFPRPGFRISLKNINQLNSGSKNRQVGESLGVFIFAVFLVVALFHLLLFLFIGRTAPICILVCYLWHWP